MNELADVWMVDSPLLVHWLLLIKLHMKII